MLSCGSVWACHGKILVLPNLTFLNLVVIVDKDVAHAHDALPWCFLVAVAKSVSKVIAASPMISMFFTMP